MSIKFASTDLSAAEYLEANYDSGERLSDKPVSVSLAGTNGFEGRGS